MPDRVLSPVDRQHQPALHGGGFECRRRTKVWRPGFVVDAQAMAALLYDFATRADYRAAVQREFSGLKALHDEYLDALRRVYVTPKVVGER